MARLAPLLLLLGLACLAPGGSTMPPTASTDSLAELKTAQVFMEELQTERQEMNRRLDAAEKELKSMRDTPKVAFAASLGGNGMQKTTSGNKDLIYREVLTNVGGAYNSQTGEFTAPVRGVYYIRFTANSPTDFPMSAVLYKNNQEVQLIVHEHSSGEGSDTASNGATLLLEEGDKLKLVLWLNTQIWDNSNHHSTFSGFLVFPMFTEIGERPQEDRGSDDGGETDRGDALTSPAAQLKKMQASLAQFRVDNLAMKARLEATEKELKAYKEIPKVAFAVSLGGNGLQKTTSGNKKLLYKDVLTNVGGAYNSETGEFTAPVRGVYYIRFTANSPTDFPMSAVLYKNDQEVQLIVHEHPSGEGSDTASNGATLLLEEGDKLSLHLWLNTQIWDNSNHHSTFSGFLLFPM
ncbi:complement C1q tumor necrosis factor-related protein 4-like [Polymixia lowei]